MAVLFDKSLFIGLDDRVAHLAAGGEAPMLHAGQTAVAEFCGLKGRGMAGRDRFYDRYRETKAMLAKLLGADSPEDIAFLANASDGINMVARSVQWRPGDEVITLSGEFPSSSFPWLAQRKHGVSLRVVDPGSDPEGAISAGVTDRTRVICVSHVSYLTGLRLDLERLGEIARSCGALLVVDASHSLGALPVAARHCDFVVSCCYKFLLATHGVGICYWNRERLPGLFESSVGWHSTAWPSLEERKSGYRLEEGATRLELGNPSFITLFVLHAALKLLLSVSPAALEEHLVNLGTEMRVGLQELDLPILTPQEPARRGTNIVFAAQDDDRIVKSLADRNVLAWSGDGRVRFSLHGYNDRQDAGRALKALTEVLAP